MAQEPRTLKPLVASVPVEVWDESVSAPVGSPQNLSTHSAVGARYVAKQLSASVPLLLSDVLAIGLASLLALAVSGEPWNAIGPAVTGFAVSCICGAMLLGLYPGVCLHPVHEMRGCVRAVAIAYIAFAAAAAAGGRYEPSAAIALTTVALVSMPGVPLMRFVARRVASRFAAFTQPVLVIGGGRRGAAAFEELRSNPASLLRPVGIIADATEQWADETTDPRWYVGVPEEAATIANRQGVYWTVLAEPSNPRAAGLVDSEAALSIPHCLRTVPALSGRQLETDNRHLGASPMIHEVDRLLLPWSQGLKRFIDLAIACVVLIPCVPVMLAIIMLIKLTSHGPAFYTERRIGRGGREFVAWKFRTMHVNAKEMLERHLEEFPNLRREWRATHKLKNDPRITKVGKILRKSSLDELPQLFNVLMGDMSLIGPRPIVSDEIPRYGQEFFRYCRVRPGVTGLWQVSGRNDTTYAARVGYDAYYAENWSVWLDAWILVRTVNVVLFCKGAY